MQVTNILSRWKYHLGKGNEMTVVTSDQHLTTEKRQRANHVSTSTIKEDVQ
jgi:hypothetical protein